jgi:hypothetical protein
MLVYNSCFGEGIKCYSSNNSPRVIKMYILTIQILQLKAIYHLYDQVNQISFASACCYH